MEKELKKIEGKGDPIFDPQGYLSE